MFFFISYFFKSLLNVIYNEEVIKGYMNVIKLVQYNITAGKELLLNRDLFPKLKHN